MTRIESFRELALEKGSAVWREANRRADLARQPAPQGVCGPPLKLLLGELGGLGRSNLAPLPEHRALRKRSVMLLPGFGSHPLRMRRMARALTCAGHEVHHWGLGWNLGPTVENFAFLQDRLRHLSGQAGQPVALVGWSLGGLFARELARRQPDEVSMVVTMGTPFSGDRRANNAWRAYQLITGHPVDAPPIETDFTAKPPVPTLAIWSPRDGVVSARAARGKPHERDREVAVRCSHLAFACDPGAILEVLKQLDRDD